MTDIKNFKLKYNKMYKYKMNKFSHKLCPFSPYSWGLVIIGLFSLSLWVEGGESGEDVYKQEYQDQSNYFKCIYNLKFH